MEHLEVDTNGLLVPLGREERGLAGVNGHTAMDNKKMSFDWSEFSTQYCSINIICPRRNSALQYPARPHEGPTCSAVPQNIRVSNSGILLVCMCGAGKVCIPSE